MKLFDQIFMSSKVLVMLGMIIGSSIGGYLPVLLGAGFLSFSSLIGSGIGGILGIYIALQLTDS